MIIVLIHWKIKSSMVEAFLSDWKRKFVVQDRKGLVGEFLSEVCSEKDFPFITWHIAPKDGERTDFINVGVWADENAFQVQIGQYFNDNRPLLDYEYERRVRTVLRPKCWRVGEASLSIPDSMGVL